LLDIELKMQSSTIGTLLIMGY